MCVRTHTWVVYIYTHVSVSFLTRFLTSKLLSITVENRRLLFERHANDRQDRRRGRRHCDNTRGRFNKEVCGFMFLLHLSCSGPIHYRRAPEGSVHSFGRDSKRPKRRPHLKTVWSDAGEPWHKERKHARGLCVLYSADLEIYIRLKTGCLVNEWFVWELHRTALFSFHQNAINWRFIVCIYQAICIWVFSVQMGVTRKLHVWRQMCIYYW